MDSIIELLAYNKIYAITGGIIILLIIVSLMSKELHGQLKKTLWVAVVLWLSCVGYEVKTGNGIGSLLVNLGKDTRDGPVEEGAFKKYISHSSMTKAKE